ncbi:hypothetical protein SCHPADRAFT_906083 [Schizopora paradoxa]|uniref:F-box domain-containing protein n=1 Tax=Schizopora paradoxa TaxID=27342 RepID=A0A0H2S2Y2_9AGAM|nr:hypothetical protein SCHPADRAFT_906083 [Schizopora paradoxa]
MSTQTGSKKLSTYEHLPMLTTPTFEGLPIDIRDLVLRLLPNYDSLKAAVLSCKAFHEAYKSRRRSIEMEVFCTQMGSYLQFHMRRTSLMREQLRSLRETGRDVETSDLLRMMSWSI